MKKILLMLAMLLPCVGAWAEIEVSTSIDSPQATYSLLSKNGAYMSAGTGATQFYIGRFAFYATDVANAYKIYSVDAQKWVSYTKSGSYTDGPNKATLIDSQAAAHAWNVVANGNYYNIAPYRTDNAVAGRYWNFHGGAGASGKTYIYDDNKTVGFYNGKGDGGSLWTLEKLTLATEEQVNEAKALVVDGPGYPKTTTPAYKAMDALEVGKSTTKHIDLAKTAYQTATDIQLPVDGKAYKFTSVMGNLVKRYMKYANGQKVAVSTNEADASVFVCKELSAGVYAFVTEDGCILTWIGNNEVEAYKENDNIYGYSTYFATEYNSKSDWNQITVKKNGNAAKDLGYLRLVGRRNSTSSSSIIVNAGNRFDQATDGYWFDNTNSSAWILTAVEHTNTDAQNTALAKIDVKNAGISFGTTVGKYNATYNGNKVTDNATVFSILDSKTSVGEVNNFKATFTLNMPVAGKFYRIKGISGNYIDASSIYNNATATTGQMSMKSEAECNLAGTIFYLNNKNHFLNYGTGRYVLQTREIGDVDATPGVWTFAESPRKNGKYALSCTTTGGAGAHLHDNAGNRADRCSSNCGDRHDFTLEEVTELPVAISAAKYATFYAPVAVEVNGVEAYTVSVDGEWAKLAAIEGGVIPAETGVVLKGTEGTYNFTITSTDATLETALRGTVATTRVAESAYVLSAPEGVVGLYLANANPFQNNACKAYLPASAVTSNTKALRFTFGGTTAIESVINGADANATIYDLSGRRVNNAVKGGIYIQNGKKFIVK